jgi:electron transfer flavoprotein alpha subunit
VIHATTVVEISGEQQYNSDVQNNPPARSARKPVQKRPTYSIEAVDNALQLLQLLRDGGALRLKDQAGCTVTVLSLAKSVPKALMQTAIAAGADRAIAVEDPAFEDLDPFSTAAAITAAIRKAGSFDLVFTGRVKALSLVERPNAPRQSENATGDKLETDGRLAVLVLN